MCLAATLVACGDMEVQIELAPIDDAPGGRIAAIDTVEIDGERYLVAPGTRDLFVRRFDDRRWTARTAEWPTGIEQAGWHPLETIARAADEAKFSSKHYFAAAGDELWVIALPAASRTPELLRSDDLGESWQKMDLPGLRDRVASERQMARSALAPTLRLLSEGDELYLIDEQRVWRKSGFQEGQPLWEEISLRGVPVGGEDDTGDDTTTDELPRMLRHYLPAFGDDTAEFVTLYGRNLEIYRRDSGAEEFQRVSTLQVPDRDLVRTPDGEALFVLGSGAVFRSEDAGVSWEQIDVGRRSLETEDYGRIELTEPTEEDADVALWVLGNAGGVWRSDDRGHTWEEMRGRDSDRRAVTGLWYDEQQREVWISTAGMGVLRSEIGSGQWRDLSARIDAAALLRAVQPTRERLYVGTDSGLYLHEAPGPPTQERRLNRRATSALEYVADDDRLLTGTVGGSVVIREGGGRADVSEAVLVGGRQQISYLPPYRSGTNIPPTAIMDLVVRPDSSEVVAWSHLRGPMISNDGGSSWRRLQLGTAFQNAIGGAVITGFSITRDQTYFAVSRSAGPQRTGQLWRSDDGGSTWQTVYTHREEEQGSPLQFAALDGGEAVAMAHDSRVATSTDGGATWTNLDGPWQDDGIVRAVDADRGDLMVLVERPHGTEIARVDSPSTSPSITDQYRLRWPTNRPRIDYESMDLQVAEDHLLLGHRDGLYRGTVSRMGTAGTDNVSLVIVFGVVLLLITTTFGVMRMWED